MSIATKPRHVPLLWILLPFAFGIFLARYLPLPDAPWLAAAAGVALLGAYLSCRQQVLPAWLVLLPLALAAIGALRFQTSHHHTKELPRHPPREAVFHLKLERLFNASDPSTSLGVARVTDASIHLAYIRQRRIFFFLENEALPAPPREGETLAAIGVLRPLPPQAESDRFDRYLRNMGIAHAYKQGYLLERVAPASGLQSWVNRASDRLADILARNERPRSELTGAYQALMLGQKDALSAEQRELFLANGTMHLFAISGLHIGVIALCFHQLLLFLRIKGAARSLLVLFAVLGFVLVTGGSASSWRAFLMIACLYLTSTCQRQTSPLNALALSAILFLLILPGQLFQAGFQMSYLTVASILLLGLPLGRTLNRYLVFFRGVPPDLQSRPQRALTVSKKWFLDALGVSIAAFATSSLLGVFYFQILPGYGVLINLFALPVASLAIVAGFLALMLSPLLAWIPLTVVFNNAAILLIEIVQFMLRGASALPASSVRTPDLPAALVAVSLLSVLFLAAIAYARSESPRAPLWQSLPLIATVAWLLAFQA